MKAKIAIFLLVALLSVPFIMALSQAENEILVPRGENTTASLPLFSRTYLRVYEGTKIDFNVVDPDTNVVLIRNSIIIQEIGRSSTKVLLSLDGKPYEEEELLAGQEMQLNYTYDFMPFMILRQMVTHYEDDSEKRNIVLFFNIPFPKTGQELGEGPGSGFATLDPNRVSPGSNNEKGIDPIVVILLSAIGLLVIALVYLNVKRFRKSKHR